MKRVLSAFALAIAVTGALFSQGAPAVERAFTPAAGELEPAIIGRLNALRSRRGLEPLRISPGLTAAARHHTRELAQSGLCGHESGDGAPFWKRISRFYRRPARSSYWAVGENVLCHPRRLTASGALREWLTSSGHRANLFSAQWREIGMAAAYQRSAAGVDEEDLLVVTADFGVRG